MALPSHDRWYRPWLLYEWERSRVWCFVCIYADKSDLLREKGKNYFWTTSKKVKTRAQLYRFIHKHWHCGHHEWGGCGE